MKRNICLLIFFSVFIFSSVSAAKEKKYPVAAIDKSLLKNANSVVRLDESNYEVIDEGHFKMSRKFAITIINSRAEDLASMVLYYDRFRNIKGLEGRLYDASGDLIRKIKQSEIFDVNIAAGQSASLTDGRVKTMKALNSTYPYTFEFEYEMAHSATFFYPDWQPVANYYQSVETDNFSVTVPDGIDFSYKESNLLTPLSISNEKAGKKYAWSLQNFVALKPEPLSPVLSEFTPYVYTRSKDFEMDGYSGSLESWATLGEWITILNEGRSELSDNTVGKLKAMVAGCKTEEEKVKVIYEYLQSKTRYVSIQLGIGGWQTAPATEVDEIGYGDCKALSNYMYAMLKAVGIEAYYMIINAGSDAKPITTDFPKSQFNHAILMVPNNNDTIWLECTSQRNPFRYLGTFTSGRKALVVNGKDSKLVPTTNYLCANNRYENTGEFKLAADGSAEVKIDSKYSGLRYDDLRRFYYEGEEEQEKFLYNKIELNDFKILNYNLGQKKGKYPEANLNLELAVKKYSTLMENKLYVSVNGFNASTYIPKRVRNRKTDVVKRYGYTESDEIKYIIPEGFEIESLPENCNLTSPFGSYKLNTRQENGIVHLSRELTIKKGHFPKDSYAEMVDFYKAIAKGDKGKFVLKTM